MTTPSLAQSLPPLDGEIAWDLEARQAAAGDFGKLVSGLPRAVLRPGSTDDIAAMLRWAAEQRWRVAARGTGHSLYGRSLAPDGLVIDMRCLDAVRGIEADRIWVGGGAAWRSVLAASLPHGLAPPVLTNYLDMSVGGTLSAGGIGGTSHRFGAQTDNVVELEVVTGDGRVLRCSPTDNAELFDTVRAGLGHVGIITGAVLRLVPAPTQVRSYMVRYPDLAALAAGQRQALARAHHLQGSILPDPSGGWTYQMGAAVFATDAEPEPVPPIDVGSEATVETEDMAYADFVTLFDGFVEALRQDGQWNHPHPWLLTFLPDSTAEQVATSVLDRIGPADLGPYGRLVFYPIDTGPFATELLRIPAEPVMFVLNLFRFLPPDHDLVGAAVTENRSLYRQVRRHGGLLYPVSAFPMRPADWKAHFGSAWDKLLDAVDHFDRHHLLAPGQGAVQP